MSGLTMFAVETPIFGRTLSFKLLWTLESDDFQKDVVGFGNAIGLRVWAMAEAPKLSQGQNISRLELARMQEYVWAYRVP